MEFRIVFEKPVRISGDKAAYRHLARAREELGLPKLPESLVANWVEGCTIEVVRLPEGFIDEYPKLEYTFWNDGEVKIEASVDALAPFVYEEMSVKREDDGAVKRVYFNLRLDKERFLETWVKAGCPNQLKDSSWFDSVEEEE